MTKKIYFIGIGGIGVSGLARYYKSIGYDVYGSDKQNSQLIEKLQQEGIFCTIGESPEKIDPSLEMVVYSSAIQDTQSELQKAKSLGIKTLTYPKALGALTRDMKLISIAGTHGKSTTTSLISLILKSSDKNFASIVGSILKEFNNSNFFYRKESQDTNFFFILESCEYKRNFLNYHPFIGVITNIEADHLDYYKDENDYINAFEEFINNIIPGGYAIMNGEDKNSKKLIGKRNDISYIIVYNGYYNINGEMYDFPKLNLQIPGDHILFDAYLAFTTAKIIRIEETKIINSLENYTGIWRRMEIVGTTENGNTLMSDYGHHPTEIIATTKALKEKYPEKKLLVIFQPHQYSRTIELLEGFKNAFTYCDKLIVPNIYESRDTEEDKHKMNGKIFINNIRHQDKIFGDGFENTLKLIEEYDQENQNSSIILLMGAGNIDKLRHKISLSLSGSDPII